MTTIREYENATNAEKAFLTKHTGSPDLIRHIANSNPHDYDYPDVYENPHIPSDMIDYAVKNHGVYHTLSKPNASKETTEYAMNELRNKITSGEKSLWPHAQYMNVLMQNKHIGDNDIDFALKHVDPITLHQVVDKPEHTIQNKKIADKIRNHIYSKEYIKSAPDNVYYGFHAYGTPEQHHKFLDTIHGLPNERGLIFDMYQKKRDVSDEVGDRIVKRYREMSRVI